MEPGRDQSRGGDSGRGKGRGRAGGGRARGGAQKEKGARGGAGGRRGRGAGQEGERGEGGARGERAGARARWGKEFQPGPPRSGPTPAARARRVGFGCRSGPPRGKGGGGPPGSARASAEGSVWYPPVPAMWASTSPPRENRGRPTGLFGSCPGPQEREATARRRRRSLFSASDARASAFTSKSPWTAVPEASGRMGRDDDPGVSVSAVTRLHAQGTTHVKYKVQGKQRVEHRPPPTRPRPASLTQETSSSLQAFLENYSGSGQVSPYSLATIRKRLLSATRAIGLLCKHIILPPPSPAAPTAARHAP